MGWLKNTVSRLVKGFPFPGRQVFWGMSGFNGERDYQRLVGDGTGNSIVAGCINFIARTFPEAPPAVWTIDKDGVRQRRLEDDMVDLINRPNPFYTGILLWMATITSWISDGNAYWLKVRNNMGGVIQLWYVPHWLIEPRWPQDGSEYITHYDYQTNNGVKRIAPSEVIHFRYGLDPDNTRKGRSPLYAVLREVFTDEEAARFSASMLKNMGVPGVVIAPAQTATGVGWKTGEADVQAVKEKYKQSFGGDRRGEPLVMSGPTSIQQFGFSPRDLDLSAIRDVPEERVTAALGLPAAVVGFGTGLQQTKVGATMAELRDQAWEGCLIPNQRILGQELALQLMPDFYANPKRYEFGFDLSRVRVLQEDQGKIATRWATLFLADLVKRKEARSAFDLISDDSDNVYASQVGIASTARGMPPTGGIPAGGAGGAAPTDGAATDGARAMSALQSQVDDLQAQIAASGKRGDTVLEKTLSKLTDALKVSKQPPSVIFQKDAMSFPINVSVPERQVYIDNAVSVPEREVTVDARTTVEPGAVVVNNETGGAGDVEIVRDSNGRVTGARRV